MAIIRDTLSYDVNTVNYLATLALFCGIACTILMLRFRGFKASFNLSSGERFTSDYHEDIPVLSSATKGAYRVNREEFFGTGSFADPPKKLDPSMVKLPPSSQPPTVKPSKSTTDLVQPRPVPQPLSKSTPDVSSTPRVVGETSKNNRVSADVKTTNAKDAKNQEKELKKEKLAEEKKRAAEEKKRVAEEKKRVAEEKKRVAEEKKREKLAAQERVKQEKERIAREKKEAQQQAKLAKAKNKTPAAKPRANPLAQEPPGPPAGPTNPPQAQGPSQGPTRVPQGPQYPTNTLESSISKSSGPPAYFEVINPQLVQNQNDNTGNTSFAKPVESSSSWDMIAQHRQEISRPPVAGAGMKQTVLDLEYTNATGRKSIYL